MLEIRSARAGDAEAVHRILQETWGEPLLFDVFREHIASPTCDISVAVEADEIVGFLSAFIVRGATTRWELDLIIVRAESRGKGIATALIRRALLHGATLGASWAKASIRVDNHASQRAFSKAGFTTDSHTQTLYLWTPAPDATPPTKRATERAAALAHLIPINSFLYRGVWIEGFFEDERTVSEQQHIIRTARRVVSDGNRLNTGMFVRDDQREQVAPSVLATATNYGQYHWWTYRFV